MDFCAIFSSDAQCALQRRARPQPGIAAQHEQPDHQAGTQRHIGGQQVGRHPARRRPGRPGRRRGETRDAAQQCEIGQGERAGPLADEAQAGVDHRRAYPQRQRAGHAQETHRRGVALPGMVGPGIPCRGNDESRHRDDLAREPRSTPHGGAAPETLGTAQVEERREESQDRQRHAQQRPATEEALRRGRLERPAEHVRADQRQHQALRHAAQRGQENDRPGGLHSGLRRGR